MIVVDCVPVGANKPEFWHFVREVRVCIGLREDRGDLPALCNFLELRSFNGVGSEGGIVWLGEEVYFGSVMERNIFVT